MAERSLFFNSIETAPGVYDREYQAQDFTEYFGSVLSTGLLHTDEIPSGINVSIVTGTLNTLVSAGKAIMKGHMYENTASLTLEHSIPEPTLDRIDRIVLRLNLNNSVREIRLRVLEGESSANPAAPELTRTNFIHDISLAQVRVRANTSSLETIDLIDERYYEDLCGFVSFVNPIPTGKFQDEWDAFMEGIQDTGFAPMERLREHEETDATTMKRGHTRLTDSITSTSTDTAATPKNVKQAYDLANFAKQELGKYLQESGWDKTILNGAFVDNDGYLTLNDPESESVTKTFSINVAVGATTTRYGFEIEPVVNLTELEVTRAPNSTFAYCGLFGEGISMVVPLAGGKFTFKASLIAGRKYVIAAMSSNQLNSYGSMQISRSSGSQGLPFTSNLFKINHVVSGSYDNQYSDSGVHMVYSFSSIVARKDHSTLTGAAEKMISPHELKAWGNLDFIKTDAGGTAAASVLTASNATLKENIASPLDISDINASSHPKIKLKFTLSRTALTNASPTFSRLQITYKAADVLIDEATGKAYKLIVSDGALVLREV